MDAPADQELKLQRSAPELIAVLKDSLPRLLWKSQTFDSTGHQVRRSVRQSKIDQLIKLLDPFQEWPQLLDPHLSALLQPLVSAFIAYLSKHSKEYHSSHRDPSLSDIIPLPRAICQILYLFCKVRGQKVIVRFLNNEPRYLEPMLNALETWANPSSSSGTSIAQAQSSMIWHERFIMLWWLSHLILVPFDLASMSSANIGKETTTIHLRVTFPSSVPPIAVRLFRISSFYLGFASKEREAAGMLLSRLALKPDMQSIGLQKVIVNAVISSIREIYVVDRATTSIHAVLGLLSFLARFTASSDLQILKPHLFSIHELLQQIRPKQGTIRQEIISSTLARKLVIKISKTIAVATIKVDINDDFLEPALQEKILGDLIDYLLLQLEDKDTSVRITASKALSLVVLELDSDMANQVIVDLIEDIAVESSILEESRVRNTFDESLPAFKPNFRYANAMKWHGLVLTLAQLLFRRAVPGEDMLTLIERLLIALRFEQRSTLGASVGTNVRDAACFGLWSIARRCTTKELSRASHFASDSKVGSILQRIANDLVVAATLDPAGNIRRGASAALQEIIGRHPDQIQCGIRLVQVVDYHAIALRSNAMLQVAVSASEIDNKYWNAVLGGLLGWRGIASAEVEPRRQAAVALGRLTAVRSSHEIRATFVLVRSRLSKAQASDVENQHGLYLALACIIPSIFRVIAENETQSPEFSAANIWDMIRNVNTSKLIREGQCRLITAIASHLPRTSTLSWFQGIFEPKSMQLGIEIINDTLARRDLALIMVATKAASGLLPLLGPDFRRGVIRKWVETVDSTNTILRSGQLGFVSALGAAFVCVRGKDDESLHQLITETLIKQLSPEKTIATRCSALHSLTSGILKYGPLYNGISESIAVALNDYTINEQGDVGSLVRIEAISATATLLDGDLLNDEQRQQLIGIVSGLATEKLDKIRLKAWSCLQPHLSTYTFDNTFSISGSVQTSSVAHFKGLLFFTSFPWARRPFLERYITSAGAGSESLVQVTRAAFCQYEETISRQASHDLCMTVVEILIENITNDRLLVPAMEFLVFLFDANIIRLVPSEETRWRQFFNQLQKSHYKSSNIAKIEAVIKLYAALASFGPMKNLVLRKLGQMLVHPYAKIRNAAAESLFIVTGEEELLAVNWASPLPEVKDPAEAMKLKLRT